MRTLLWSQLRLRRARSLALLAGMLVAVTAFTVLTAASRTSQLRTIGRVSAHFRSAYDILVRPDGARTRLETRTGTVQPNFLSGIYGGITMAQYREIRQIPGVQVAAPIAMVGYLLPEVPIMQRLPAAAARGHDRQLYRVSTTWVSAAGSVRIPQPPSYVYLTSDKINAAGSEVLPDGSPASACDGYPVSASYPPFSPAEQSGLWCWSRVNGLFGRGSWEGLTAQRPGLAIRWSFPMLVTAVDPAAEAQLDGLNRAVTSGRYLGEHSGVARESLLYGESTFPVLAADTSGVGEYAAVQVQRLPDPARPPALTPGDMARDAAVPGRVVARVTVTAGQAYRQLLSLLTGSQYQDFNQDPNGIWQTGPTSYRRGPGGSLVPLTVSNPQSNWRFALPGLSGPPMDEAATAYRAIHEHEADPNIAPVDTLVPRAVGVFDPARIRAFDSLTEVPLGPYQPDTATPGNAASRRALSGHDLLPSLNLGGYVSQPVQLVTTLSALPALEDGPMFRGLHAADPISVIRVRVAGVTGPNPVSLTRIRQVAQQIETATHLTVDIVAGSSPAPTSISLPAGKFGQPALRLTEPWVKQGVAVAVLSAVDKKSVVLFTLVLLVCALFVANAATAAVRSRRHELGVLACLGWTRPRIYGAVLSELALLGLAAGIAGGVLSLPLATALHLDASPGRAILAVPAAVGLALAAGSVPAWLASRADPVVTVRPPVLAAGRAHHPRGVAGLAVINVRRTPGRSLLGACSLAVGVAALTLLIAVTLAFRGTVVGSLLGNAVAVQVRGVDYIAVTATVALGVLAVTDVLFLNVRERASELAVIRALGWPESAIGQLIVAEGAVIGLAGSLAGAAAGLAAAAAFAGQFPARLLTAAAATVLTGVAVTVAAALLPAQLLRRLPTAQLLAEE